MKQKLQQQYQQMMSECPNALRFFEELYDEREVTTEVTVREMKMAYKMLQEFWMELVNTV